MIVNKFKFLDIEFDIYDCELDRIPKKGLSPYFITPKKLDLIEAWMIDNMVFKLANHDQLDFLLKQNWIQEYKC